MKDLWVGLRLYVYALALMASGLAAQGCATMGGGAPPVAPCQAWQATELGLELVRQQVAAQRALACAAPPPVPEPAPAAPTPYVLGPAVSSATGAMSAPSEATASVDAGGAQGAVVGRVVLTESAAAAPAGASRTTVLLVAAGLGAAALVLALR